jgi:hypothetical protein
MIGMIWLYVVCGLFALLGVWTFMRSIVTGWKRFMATVNDLTSTLKDASEVAKAYREDVQILKQIAQSAPTPNFGGEPESIIPESARHVVSMPSPYFDRFPSKPVEEDAPMEASGDVDVTPTDEELIEQEKNNASLDFESQERQKAATREADQMRIRELADLGINEKPEGK